MGHETAGMAPSLYTTKLRRRSNYCRMRSTTMAQSLRATTPAFWTKDVALLVLWDWTLDQAEMISLGPAA